MDKKMHMVTINGRTIFMQFAAGERPRVSLDPDYLERTFGVKPGQCFGIGR